MTEKNTIVLTVHNKEKTIARILNGLLDCSSDITSHLIVVMDGCTDASGAQLQQVLASRSDARMKITVIETDDVWETRANNAGLRLAETEYVTIIQDDMLLRHPSWDLALLHVFRSMDLFAVSGRASHDFSLKGGRFEPRNLAGREFPLGINTLVGRVTGRFMLKFRPYWIYRYWAPVAVALTVNRGPLMLRRELLSQLDFLDDAFAPFELDDVDLCCRAYKKWGLKSASRPIAYEELGGSKATSSISSEMSARCIEKNTQLLLQRHRELSLES